jgi:uncharacterized membrane protein YdfJ with MMPL/SSD domain
MHVAERAARWSAAHWKTATLGWLAFVVAAVLAGSAIGTRSLTLVESSQGDSARAEAILADGGFSTPAGEAVLVHGSTAADRRAAAADLSAALGRVPAVARVLPPALSHDRRSELVGFELRGNPDTAEDRVAPVLAAVAAVQRAHGDVALDEFGTASANRALNDLVDRDLQRAERLSVPVTFLILLLAFGAFVAAGVPVLLAFSAVLASIGLGAVASQLVHASDTTSSVVVLMGMAVGVDYSLFYLKREREERARGRAGRDALHAAAATSGRAVLISGLTVVVACAGMLLSGSNDFVSLGVGAILVVLVAMVGSLTVLPALLGKLEDRVERGVLAVLAAGLLRVLGRQPRALLWLCDRRTLLQRVKGDRAESRLWGLALGPVLRHPRVSALAAVALLAVVALPALGMRTANPGVESFPQDLPVVQAYQRIQRAFPGTPSPAEVVVSAPDVTAPAVTAGIADLKRRALATGELHAPIDVSVNADRTVARVGVPLAGSGDDARSFAALRTLRSEVIPASLGSIPGVEAAVTGDTAQGYDFNRTMTGRTPLVFAFVLVVAFVLLLLAFRSVVVPATAIALNLLSVGAAYGLLVWIFQDGHLEGLLGFHSNGAVVTWLPLFLFTILFGLSMDYHVFIVSRIRELVAGGCSTEQAVARGIRTTASTVTSAAAVMVAVFSIFATADNLVLKQMGVGLAAAVLLDATVIRGVLLPATMKILGEWNWYLPRRLGWLPRLELERGPSAPAALDRVGA